MIILSAKKSLSNGGASFFPPSIHMNSFHGGVGEGETKRILVIKLSF